MRIHQTKDRYETTRKRQKPWAFKCPKNCKEKKITRNKRLQVAKSHTTIQERHLATTNKNLSALASKNHQTAVVAKPL